MAKIFNRVKPGDLITAELMNKMMDTVEELDDRLAVMETAAKGSISGTVKDAAADAPIVGARVRAVLGNVTSESPPTDSSGMFTITDLLPGDYLVTASAENYINSAAQTVSVSQGVGRVVNFVLTPAAGLVIVPKLFGLSLAQAKAALTDPSVGLVPGDVIATDGELILPTNTDALAMVVLNQVPDAGEAVQSGSSVDMVIASLPSEPPISPVTPPPTITGFTPSKSEGGPIGQPIHIHGTNFDLLAGNNEVTFAGESVPETPTSPVPTKVLRVVVPDVPDPPGVGEVKEVTVIVKRLSDNASVSAKYNVLPPLSGTNPHIDSIDTSPNPMGVVGYSLVIEGNDFSSTTTENHIWFDAIETSPTIASTTELEVTVPSNIPGLTMPGTEKVVNIKVVVGGLESNIFELSIAKPMF